jgi:hypothetical protein
LTLGKTTPGKREGERFEIAEGRSPEAEDSHWIKEDMCLQIINSGILTYKRNKSFRIESPEG